MSTILFVFAGRRANMELQLPFIHRILDEHPEVQCHLWNLARAAEDDEYLRTLHLRHNQERLIVINDFHGPDPWKRMSDVYRYYMDPEFAGSLFVKMDDDVVFIETERFGDFTKAVDTNRNSVISAKVINNGACTLTEPGLRDGFEALGINLLDVHLSSEYAEMSHRYLFNHWTELVGQQSQLIPTPEWLSINLIGYDWAMGKRIAEALGTQPPRYIAGRQFRRIDRMGDEGAVNTLPRLIHQGFLAAHLSFGPQKLPDAKWDELRALYAEVGSQYLDQGLAA